MHGCLAAGRERISVPAPPLSALFATQKAGFGRPESGRLADYTALRGDVVQVRTGASACILRQINARIVQRVYQHSVGRAHDRNAVLPLLVAGVAVIVPPGFNSTPSFPFLANLPLVT